MTPLTEAFLRLTLWRPWRALAITYWHLTRRRVRARNWLRDAISDAPFRYTIQSRIVEQGEAVVQATLDLVANWPERPTFSIILLARRGCRPGWIEAAVHAILDQGYDRWDVLIIGAGAVWTGPGQRQDRRVRVVSLSQDEDPSTLERAIGMAQGDFVIPLSEGVELARTAMLRFAQAVRTSPEQKILYGDEDAVDRYRRRLDPWFKPLWNAEMILAIDYVSHACAVRTVDARICLGDSVFTVEQSVYALILAMTRDTCVPVVHVPHIVAHVDFRTRSEEARARVATVAARVMDAGATAEAGPHRTVTVRWPMPDPAPEVAILIPTRDKIDLVRTCVESVLAYTRYDRYRIIIIDNGSTEAATIAYFDDIAHNSRVTVLACAMPYNFSAINNFAVANTDSPFLCFLNNDTEVIDGDWLGEMMRYAVRPGIGAVGAQLLYEDRSIQHAGVVMGLGNAAGHAHRALRQEDAGYFAQAHAAHYASAVTAACMVVERDKFLAVGGFDAEHLQIAYNDVDLCLKLGRKGWRNVYAPQAKLLHLESKSRGFDLSPAHVDRYMKELAVLQRRWDTTRIVDPMHHPLLDRSSETYRVAL